MSKKKHVVRYDTDLFALKIFSRMLGDFRSVQGSSFCVKAETALKDGGISGFRDYSFPEIGIISPYRYKMYNQLASLFKKYRFKNDKYSDAELSVRTFEKFESEQLRIASTTHKSLFTFYVLRTARKIAKSILGPYDPEYTCRNSRFGKKSSIGCPLNLAYIDEKLSNSEAFTGSSECSKWFFKDLGNDPILEELVNKLTSENKGRRLDLEHDSLTLVQVPKTWKISRTITPLTLLALYYSYGVGEQVTERLKKAGLDIAKLQMRHRKLIQRFSRQLNSTLYGGSHATADLSSASDSISSDLLNRVLPREWYNAIKKTFSRTFKFNGKNYYTASILPMGNGLTFPVETLVFYSIIKAIGDLTRNQGIYSVYGDDLIYPSNIHKYVVTVFAECGFKLNLEKTFVSYPYRESCGAEFYRGVDVRPFFLPGEHRMLTKTQYLSWLYQVYNGLRRRWEECEISLTLRQILHEIAIVSVDTSVLRVPPLFPDTAGIRVNSPLDIPLQERVINWSPIKIQFLNGSRWFSFSFLDQMPRDRFIRSIMPYYWLALQGKNDDVPTNFWDIDSSIYSEPPRQPLRWKTVTIKKKRKRGFKLKHIQKLVCTARSSMPVYSTKRTRPESISDWLEDSYHLL